MGGNGATVSNADTYEMIKRYLALPFLPASDIPEVFRILQQKSSESQLMASFARYMQRTWVANKALSIESWSAFGEVVRLDTDVNEWQSKLLERKNEMRARMPFYLLVMILYDETHVLADACLIDNQRLKLRARLPSAFPITDYWERYTTMSDSSPYDLLCECTKLLGDDLQTSFGVSG